MRMTLAVGLVCLVMQSGSGLSPDARADGGDLYVNQVKVLSLRSVNGGVPASEVAAKAAERIGKAAAGERAAAEVKGGASLISMGGRPVLSVSKAEAKAQLSDLKALGELWAGAINRALDLPALALTTERIVIPLGGTRSVAGLGAGFRVAKYSVADKSVAGVTVGNGELILKGLARGQTMIEGKYGESMVNLEVTVLPVAATLPQSVTAQVMGQPASADVVESAVATAARTRLGMADGSRVTVGEFKVNPLMSGMVSRVSVPVSVSAPGHFPVSGNVSVMVSNIGSGRVFEDLLWYSNNPENLLDVGPLYWGDLKRGQPVRLLAHHYNKTSRPMVVQYVLANGSDFPASVAVIMGDAAPDKDPTKVGYRAGNEFFKSWLGHSAEVVQVPPRSVVPLIMRRLAPVDTMSALGTLRLLSGDCEELALIGVNRWSSELPEFWEASLQRARPWQYSVPLALDSFDLSIAGSGKDVFVNPLRQISFEYEHGGKFAFIRIGQEAIESVDGGQRLLGNFGVHYLIEGTIANPSDRKQKVEVVFEASAGYSGAIFTVNGQYVDAALLQTKQKFSLLEVTLEPGETRNVRIQTVPLSGAHYPATITVRPPGDH